MRAVLIYFLNAGKINALVSECPKRATDDIQGPSMPSTLCDIFTELKSASRCKSPGPLIRWVFILDENTRPQTAMKNYSPDCDHIRFSLFSCIKSKHIRDVISELWTGAPGDEEFPYTIEHRILPGWFLETDSVIREMCQCRVRLWGKIDESLYFLCYCIITKYKILLFLL